MISGTLWYVCQYVLLGQLASLVGISEAGRTIYIQYFMYQNCRIHVDSDRIFTETSPSINNTKIVVFIIRADVEEWIVTTSSASANWNE